MGADHPRRGRAFAGHGAGQPRWAAENARAQLSRLQPPDATARRPEARPARRGLEDRHALHLGRRDRPRLDALLRPAGARRLRLLRLRVARRSSSSGHPAGTRIGGRTAAQMAGEIRKRARLRLDEVRPGDLVFFGRANFAAKATEASVDHVGIALSAHWMIHASAQGVYVSSLDEGWRQDRFTWARPRTLNPARRRCVDLRNELEGLDRAQEQDRRGPGHRRRRRRQAWPPTASTARPAATYSLSADRSKLKFNKTTIRAKAGRVTLKLSNPSSLPHNIGIKGKGIEQDDRHATSPRPTRPRSRRAPTPSIAPSARTSGRA